NPSYGTCDGRHISTTHAACCGFNCINPNTPRAVQWNGAVFNINVTDMYRDRLKVGDTGAWFMVWGEEEYNSYYSYKLFAHDRTSVTFTYDAQTPMATPATPADGVAVTTTQPQLRVNPVTDPDGDQPWYYFRLATGSDAETGTIANSGWISTPQWAVPEGVLEDGTTYYWHAYTWDKVGGVPHTPPDWKRSFRVDMRTGKDATQSFDTVGAISTNLATGNVSTGAATHASGALGGSLGVSLDYNSPAASRPGLIGEYWNDNARNLTFSGAPQATRVDPAIDFYWNSGSPVDGTIGTDYFLTRWSGYFVAPTEGNYTFRSEVDDRCRLWVKDQLLLDYWGSWCGWRDAAPIFLKAGEAVPIKMEFAELTGGATARLWVKGPVPEQVVPAAWLQTGVRPTAKPHGLTGSYFHDPGNHVFPTENHMQIVTRTDQQVAFRWGSGSPVPSGPVDRFMARWSGYFTAPVAGDYTFGSWSDDGSRITVNNQLVLNDWVDSGFVASWGSAVRLNAGQSVPIVVEFYENGGGAAIDLVVKGAVPEQVVPAAWLAPNPPVLPAGWNLGVDPDGDLAYDRLKVNQSSVVLTNSSGETHEYKVKDGTGGTGYTPPTGEDGHLVKNTDSTYTLQDTDGRTYVFNADGTLKETATALDDRKPAALKYEYSGTPARLTKIVDGVTADRFATLHYSGDSTCVSPPTGFEATPPGMLCAAKTNDGRMTKLFYASGRLSRLEGPGDEVTEWGYDVLGRIIQIREPLAGDMVLAGLRASNDDTITTQIAYDGIGRAKEVILPAPASGASRGKHTYDYFTGSTLAHVQGASQPNGFSRKVEYDATFRTTKDIDLANLATTTEWDAKDLVLSKTDPVGLKSTTLYDDDDRPTHQYGPAPAAWFGADRSPTSTYASQVPHTETAYDESISGLATSYYNFKADGKVLFGAPKLHATGIGGPNGDVVKTWGATAPITPDPTYGWGARLTGDIRLAEAGNHTFRIISDDGVRLYVDDKLVIDDWNNGGQRTHTTGIFNNLTAGKAYRIRLDYYDAGGSDAKLELYKTAPGGVETSALGAILMPRYGLSTTEKTFDAQIGDVVAKTNYGAEPELGLAKENTLDPTGLNYNSSAAYEARGQGFLRQTSKTLPGGTATSYVHWSGTDTADNPCTAEVEAYRQAGMMRKKTETDPDGTGPQVGRIIETAYDEAGRIIATRYNSDPWTCTKYDDRGRVVETKVPQIGDKAGRTITNNWKVDGNPLKVSSSDDKGTISTETDLLGRTTTYTDTWGNVTTSSYDQFGKLVSRSGPLGSETFVYNNLDRLIEQKLDNVIL
ncbi:MAG TPA: PA14 domain-containing protein, partial [Candidatus Saccharimonadales bacterium]|nr:PA14 domain-containing protein [Candidatus Saccharimonadales bacterium]